MEEKGDLKKLVLISSTENATFAQKIAGYLSKPLAVTERTDFRDTDFKVRIGEKESVRGKHACLIMTYEPPIAERIQEAMVWTDALMSGSLNHLTMVWPYFIGARQDRKTLRGEPINARAYINAIKGVASDQVAKLGWMTADLHAPQLQALAMTFDNFTALPLFASHIKKNYSDFVVVAPDTGRLKACERLASMVKAPPPECIPKTRDENGSVKNHANAGDLKVSGKTAVIYDDMIDSCGTLVRACELVRNAGAKEIVIYATHLLLNGPAEENIHKMNARIVGTDSVYHSQEKLSKLGITTLPISYIFAEAIKRQHLGISTRELHTQMAGDIISEGKYSS